MPVLSSPIRIYASALDRIEQFFESAFSQSPATALILAESSGVVLALAGEPPLPAEQAGPALAGLLGSMNLLIGTRVPESFCVEWGEGKQIFFQSSGKSFIICAWTERVNGERKIPELLQRLSGQVQEALKHDDPDARLPAGIRQDFEQQLDELLPSERQP